MYCNDIQMYGIHIQRKTSILAGPAAPTYQALAISLYILAKSPRSKPPQARVVGVGGGRNERENSRGPISPVRIFGDFLPYLTLGYSVPSPQ